MPEKTNKPKKRTEHSQHPTKHSNTADSQETHKKTEEVQQIKHELVNFAQT